MEFKSCIKDECGEIVMWCSDYPEDEIQDCLDQHPEWYRSCVEV